MSLIPALTFLASDDALVWADNTPPADAATVEAVLVGALDGAYTLVPRGSAPLELTHLDTVDGRVRRAGLTLVYSGRDRRLVALAKRGAAVDQAAGQLRWPAVLDRVPAGPVRELLTGPVWVRALQPQGKTRAHGRTFGVLNDDLKTVARITWWSGSGDARAPRIQVAPLRGYDKDARKIIARLTATAPVHQASESWFATTLPSAQHAEPVMTADQPGVLAVAHALLGYLDDLDANLDGVIEDVDVEFLHDFRVDVRRTRSILKILGDALPAGMAPRVAPEFRWLGQVTTPTRDLDVYLLGIPEMAAAVTNPKDLAPFAEHLRLRRAGARRALVRALRSRRFADLQRSWRADLEAVIAAPPDGSGTAAQLADRRLHRAFRKVTKLAAAIDATSPADDVHALRKKCKEFRYLIEVFKPICDDHTYRQVIGDFKDLQNVLGEFQDGEVQAAALRVFAQEMIEQGEAPASALLAMGDLAARFDERQRAARRELTDRHGKYLGKRAAQHLDRLIRS